MHAPYMRQTYPEVFRRDPAQRLARGAALDVTSGVVEGRGRVAAGTRAAAAAAGVRSVHTTRVGGGGERIEGRSASHQLVPPLGAQTEGRLSICKSRRGECSGRRCGGAVALAHPRAGPAARPVQDPPTLARFWAENTPPFLPFPPSPPPPPPPPPHRPCAMASDGAERGSTNPITRLLPLKYTSPAPGEGPVERNVIRYTQAARKDDVEAAPIFRGLDGSGVRVAVLDTGIDAGHPALQNRVDMAAARNYSNVGGPSDVTDRQGHGTHCAGIIAAEDLGAIMSGIAPRATVVPIKVLNDNGEGRTEWSTAGIRHAIAQRVDVINMSLGIDSDETAFEVFLASNADEYKAIQEALAAGIVVVVAAGNQGRRSSLNEINPPGSYGGVITVASHNDAGERSEFSSMGGELDLMAPGETFSTYARGQPYEVSRGVFRPGRDYEHLGGTSMACPLVAGLAALLVQAGRAGRGGREGLSNDLRHRIQRSNFGARNNYEVREMLRYLADRPHEHRREDGYGTLGSVYTFVKITVRESLLTVEGGGEGQSAAGDKASA
ncbi:hypothetical protein I4F81_008831 [Pyropia yezoensis]|uniref:Uncharacterized protein n=1 Tax=Pyropia yezoensis TaxID=2788 RepID=A0ACC3C7N5_PYRYE|nr:hypothetical protein I4F81_008831 [Neopyropia yezoensis]